MTNESCERLTMTNESCDGKWYDRNRNLLRCRFTKNHEGPCWDRNGDPPVALSQKEPGWEVDSAGKLIRTKCKWVEICYNCNGKGSFHKEEYFTLCTPDESGRSHSVGVTVPEDAYICEVIAGATIDETCREAEEIAKVIGRPVVFNFNDTVLVIRKGDDPTEKADEWSYRMRSE